MYEVDYNIELQGEFSWSKNQKIEGYFHCDAASDIDVRDLPEKKNWTKNVEKTILKNIT